MVVVSTIVMWACEVFMVVVSTIVMWMCEVVSDPKLPIVSEVVIVTVVNKYRQ